MNILITGYEGFLGNSLVGKLKGLENLVVGFDRGGGKPSNNPDVVFNGDIRDTALLRKIIDDYAIEEVYHFAGQAIAGKCSNDPENAFDINIMGTVSLLEACRTSSDKKIKSIVLSNSNKIFGDSPAPYTEETPMKPRYIYDTSKACQRLIALSYFHNYDLPVKVMICTNVYGPGDLNLTTRIIPNNITSLAKGGKAQLSEEVKTHTKEFIYIDDVVDAFITVGRKGKSGESYCCGGTEPITVEGLVRKICETMGKRYPEDVERFTKPVQFKEIETQSMDAKKLIRLGWRPKVSLEEGLKRTIKYYEEILRREI